MKSSKKRLDESGLRKTIRRALKEAVTGELVASVGSLGEKLAPLADELDDIISTVDRMDVDADTVDLEEAREMISSAKKKLTMFVSDWEQKQQLALAASKRRVS